MISNGMVLQSRIEQRELNQESNKYMKGTMLTSKEEAIIKDLKDELKMYRD